MSTVRRVNQSIRLLSQRGAEVLKPTYTNGIYCGPLVSRRKAADLRKLALKDGTFGSFTPMQGGWDPAWDAPRKIFMLRPYKGHKRERTRAARAQKIDAAMKGMPDRFEKIAKEKEAKKPRKNFLYHVKRLREIMNRRKGKPSDVKAADKNAAKGKNAKNAANKKSKGKK